MDFSLSEQQEMLRKFSRDFLGKECPMSLVREMVEDERGYPPELWRKIADLGWLGLGLPHEHGGVGGSYLDQVVLMEEMGRACLPGPFHSVMLASMVLLEAGDERHNRALLPRIAKGDLIITLALTEPSADYTVDGIHTRATPRDKGYNITGTKLFVPDAHIADYLICVARTEQEEIGLFLVDRHSQGVSCNLLKTMVGDKQYEVVFSGVDVPKEALVGKPARGRMILQRALQKGALAKCAEMVGGAQRVLEMTVDYVKQRIQFEHPVGSFQAVQHHCADMVIYLDGARLITYEAAWMLSEGIPCAKEVAMAKAWTSEAFKKVTALGHQAHGGVSVIEDHDLTLYSSRAKQWEIALGDPDFHREIIAQELGL